jgi:ABC-type phosphate/phosphonate transport system substrate-binding protein
MRPVHGIRWPRFLAAALVALAVVVPAQAQTRAPAKKGTEAKKGADAAGRLIFAVNEGASGNVDAADIILRYEELKRVIERAAGVSLTLVAVREPSVLRSSLESGAYALVFSRPVNSLALAIRDHKYQAVVMAKEPGQAIFVAAKDSPLKTIAELKGKSIVTPEEGSYMWHIVNAMLRDAKIAPSEIKRKTMRDQAAIGWSVTTGFFDAGVIASFSGVAKTWEKQGGRIITKSRDVPVTPIIASPRFSESEVKRMRSALVALDGTESGAAIFKRIGISGFKEAEAAPFLELLEWLALDKK